MPNTAVITVEGVLQKIVSRAPIPSGISLYHALNGVFNVILVSDSSKEGLEYWLSLEGLNSHATVLFNENELVHKTPLDRRVSQINSLRSRGFYVELVVEPDPSIAAAILRGGFSVLNYLHSSYSLPEWRPDYESRVKPWHELKEEAVKQALLKSQDERLAKTNE